MWWPPGPPARATGGSYSVTCCPTPSLRCGSATFGIASTILIESSLSFLGFGVQTSHAQLGDILSQSRDFMDFAWWLTLIIPDWLYIITITSYNLVGEGLQDALDPKSVNRR
jgi:ABC-type dipeptide/oligopeptide/nickel transport system permease subunit